MSPDDLAPYRLHSLFSHSCLLTGLLRIAYFHRTYCESRLCRYMIALLPSLYSLVSFHRHESIGLLFHINPFVQPSSPNPQNNGGKISPHQTDRKYNPLTPIISTFFDFQLLTPLLAHPAKSGSSQLRLDWYRICAFAVPSSRHHLATCFPARYAVRAIVLCLRVPWRQQQHWTVGSNDVVIFAVIVGCCKRSIHSSSSAGRRLAKGFLCLRSSRRRVLSTIYLRWLAVGGNRSIDRRLLLLLLLLPFRATGLIVMAARGVFINRPLS